MGAFPAMELGGVAERPEQLRKWRYAVRQCLEAAGPVVTEWWTWCWYTAELGHMLYL